MKLRTVIEEMPERIIRYQLSENAVQAMLIYREMLLQNESLICQAGTYYKLFFETEILPPDFDTMPDNDGQEQGMLFAMVFFARCELFGEALEKQGIPAQFANHGPWHFCDLFERNKRCYGTYGFRGMYREGMVKYVKPKTFTIGRLSFEMNVFHGPYVVYKSRKNGRLVPLAVSGLNYLKNGKQAPKNDKEIYFTTELVEGDAIKGNTFHTDGSLNFETVTLDGSEYEKILADGDPVLSVHIPGHDKMTPELVADAFTRARDFFKTYYKEKGFKAFVCSSWLLDTGLARFLKSDSNIIKFQKEFTIALSFVNTFAIYWNIFGVENFVPYEELVPKNRFQQQVLEWVKSGEYLYSGNGFILF